ncbi:hypothetical protein PSENEW3_00003986 [Picochlorum sp. SENEW3]|nr:hypothetical protein PSENEW3_00003986 [Picochlorum sp. SENEW3]
MGLVAKYLLERNGLGNADTATPASEQNYFRFHMKAMGSLHCISNSCDNLLGLDEVSDGGVQNSVVEAQPNLVSSSGAARSRG